MGRGAYGEHNVNHIHDAQNDMTGTHQVVCVAGRDQGAGDDMVRKHLNVVFSPLLDLEDKNLL